MASTRRVCSSALRASSRMAAPAVISRRCFAVASASSRTAPCTTSTRPMAAAAPAAPRPYSSKSNDSYHEIAANGSKLWNFEQMRTLAKNPHGVVIVDSREPGEVVETGRIPTAINIPVVTAPESFHISDEDFKDRFGFPRPGKDKELVFYCKAGVRSRALAALAREAGWEKVGEYPGSWLDWAKNGGEVQKRGKGPSE